jgi:hypothetical protein
MCTSCKILLTGNCLWSSSCMYSHHLLFTVVLTPLPNPQIPQLWTFWLWDYRGADASGQQVLSLRLKLKKNRMLVRRPKTRGPLWTPGCKDLRLLQHSKLVFFFLFFFRINYCVPWGTEEPHVALPEYLHAFHVCMYINPNHSFFCPHSLMAIIV